MNSVKSICDNFDSMSVNVKEDLLLYGDSPFDENKNKVILKATINSDHLVINLLRVNYC